MQLMLSISMLSRVTVDVMLLTGVHNQENVSAKGARGPEPAEGVTSTPI